MLFYSLPSSTSDNDLEKKVHKHFLEWGLILGVKASRDQKSRPHAFVQYERVDDANRAFVKFCCRKNAIKAFTNLNSYWDLVVELSENIIDFKIDRKTICISRLTFEVTEEMLQMLHNKFGIHGGIEKLDISESK